MPLIFATSFIIWTSVHTSTIELVQEPIGALRISFGCPQQPGPATSLQVLSDPLRKGTGLYPEPTRHDDGYTLCRIAPIHPTGQKGPFPAEGFRLLRGCRRPESPTVLGRSEDSQYTNDSGSRLNNYCKLLSNWRLLQPANLEYLRFTTRIHFLMQFNGGTCYNPEAL